LRGRPDALQVVGHVLRREQGRLSAEDDGDSEPAPLVAQRARGEVQHFAELCFGEERAVAVEEVGVG